MATWTTSAGVLPFRVDAEGAVSVLIGHMGGPFWANKDDRAWSIFKGEYVPADEAPIEAARREFTEETGQSAPAAEALLPLGAIKQKSGKTVHAWAVEAPDLDPSTFESNPFEMEWPPRSGRMQSFPEIDRAAWLPIAEAEPKLVAAQAAFLERLAESLRA